MKSRTLRIHHFYPRTNNIGDHFVQRGIERMVQRLRPQATFELFDVNSRGRSKTDFGLTQRAVERANQDADLIIVGGSNLYEGSYRWPWGVHHEPEAIKKLRVPLLMMGIGSGSNFNSPLHRPSKQAEREIRLLNDYASFSGARDIITLDWMHNLGIEKAQLSGDPATFIFNDPATTKQHGHILVVVPPRRFWSSKRQLWKVRRHGRAMFRALASLARSLVATEERVVVVCNDPLDLPIAKSLFADLGMGVVCPVTTEEYFSLLTASRGVISGRLHTAVVAFSMGLPFMLLNVDKRTDGFIKTYQLERWSLVSSQEHIESDLQRTTAELLRASEPWTSLIQRRDDRYKKSMKMLEGALP